MTVDARSLHGLRAQRRITPAFFKTTRFASHSEKLAVNLLYLALNSDGGRMRTRCVTGDAWNGMVLPSETSVKPRGGSTLPSGMYESVLCSPERRYRSAVELVLIGKTPEIFN